MIIAIRLLALLTIIVLIALVQMLTEVNDTPMTLRMPAPQLMGPNLKPVT